MRPLAIALLLVAASASWPAAATVIGGCELCADTGNCSIAFHGHPGQYCGNWIDHYAQHRHCCCPTNSSCQLSTYDCRCTYAPSSPRASSRTSAIDDWLLWVVAMALLAICCCLIAPQAIQPERQVLAGGATPIYGGTIADGMSAGTSALLGGTAGLLGGILIGERLADSGRRDFEDDNFDGGDGGGPDFSGDV